MHLLGVRIDDLPKSELVTSVIEIVNQDQRAILAYVNVHAINLAQNHPWFRKFLNDAALAYCDGFGVILGARLSGDKLVHRSTPPDWISDLASQCALNDISLYFLGGQPGVAEDAAAFLVRHSPNLKIKGTLQGYFDTTSGGVDNETAILEINRSGSDILFVGLGMPLQERWLLDNWEHLNIKVALTVGALLDYLAGERRRPPKWMTDNGLEWLGRMYYEPVRLWKRYLLGIPYFFLRIMRLRLGL